MKTIITECLKVNYKCTTRMTPGTLEIFMHTYYKCCDCCWPHKKLLSSHTIMNISEDKQQA